MANINRETINKIADRLLRARELRQPIEPISIDIEDIDLDDAYAIQLYGIAKDLEAGAKVTGKKIGLTSEAMQTMLGVGEPDYGHLLDSMEVEDGTIEADSMLLPRVEAEIAFVLKQSLTGPNVTVDDVISATDYVVAALEIVDSRVRDWQIKLIDTVADNASSGRYILGEIRKAPESIDLISEEMSLSKNEVLVNSGSGSAVLGNPAYCVAWLANRLHDYGVTLNAGEVVLSGALSAAIDAIAGDTFRATFSNLGSVSVSFK
ncbi:MAG: fumarylacetoacetate hydrolase family protein [Coriobacteriia bacterium]|nr:fumarylacetoacetate hydrolase family protein [Coriobacteriia bacterium]